MDISLKQVTKQVITVKGSHVNDDFLIAEEPLQINLCFDTSHEPNSKPSIFSITMRTPGDEENLILGLLLSEQIIYSKDEVISMQADNDSDTPNNVWEVELSSKCKSRLSNRNRTQTTYSSCGLCGTRNIESLALKNLPKLSLNKYWLRPEIIYQVSNNIERYQRLQKKTGAAHCAALLDSNGDVQLLKEDIGRHNALDKLVGSMMNSKTINKETAIFVISSRVSFEMVQKTLISGVSVLVAIGAPSSLAVSAAKHFNLTLIAFTKSSQFNVYHDEQRLIKQD